MNDFSFRKLRSSSLAFLAATAALTTQAPFALAQAGEEDDKTPAVGGQREDEPASDVPETTGTDEEPTEAEEVDGGSEESQEEGAGAQVDRPQPKEAAPKAAPTAEQYAALEARLAALEAAREEEMLNALTEDEAEASARQDPLKIYGFMDMGVQRMWVDNTTIIAGFFESNAWTFATGNIDFYFDANPHPDWRGLAEIRFTNAPRGRINNFGGIAGTFEREDTMQFDPSGTSVNAPLWLGGVVIERAWIEWKRYQSFRVRTGNFFTPFGIWNVDHGQPTLISAVLPQFMLQTYFPIRQTGVQALGSFFAQDWELGYSAWLTNGREEMNNLDFDDDKAVGTRLTLRNDVGKVKSQFGASVHHGRVRDKVVNITNAPTPDQLLEFEIQETMAYHETALGLDVSLDIHNTRIRAEGIAHLSIYEDGKRGAPQLDSEVPDGVPADDWRFGGYLLVAQRLNFWGLEPYLYSDIMQQNRGFPDGIFTFGPGFNVHFNPSALLKVQASRGWVFDWTEDLPGDATRNDTYSFVARVVLAF